MIFKNKYFDYAFYVCSFLVLSLDLLYIVQSNYIGAIFITTLIILVVAVFLAKKYRDYRLKKAEYERNPQKEILEIFNEAEKQMKGGLKEDGTTNPYSILWSIAKERGLKLPEITRTNRDESTVSTTEQPVNSGELCPEPNRREDISTGIVENNIGSSDKPRQSKPNDIKSVLSKLRRRSS